MFFFFTKDVGSYGSCIGIMFISAATTAAAEYWPASVTAEAPSTPAALAAAVS